MKIAVFLLLLCSSVVFGQKKDSQLTASGEPFELGKGWKIIEMFATPDGKVKMAYTYKSDTIIKFAPNGLKFWVKIKDYREKDAEHSMHLYEVKCGERTARVTRVTIYKESRQTEDLKDPTASFEDVVPDSLNDMILTAVCAKELKPQPK